MDLTNLRERHVELLSYMEANDYSATYIKRFRDEVAWILQNESGNEWGSYADIYSEYLKVPHSNDYLRNKRTIIGALEQFDVCGRFPDGRTRHTLFERGSYHLLVPEFRELIGFYRMIEKQRGKKDETIRGESYNAATFLHEMQAKGFCGLDDITEEAVLSFFLSDDGELLRGCSYRKNISAVFKAGLQWKERECRKILSYLPGLRETRKDIRYLTAEEVHGLRGFIEGEGTSLRDKAVIFLLLYTGLRSCDIAGLALGSMDWDGDRLLVNQQKTDVPLELPLSALVGNAIYDYIAVERPGSGDGRLFLSETKPFTPLSSGSIGNIVAKAFKAAGIRRNPGDRKGTHIFRHNVASSMLENGVPRPVITQALGHLAPDSLEPYLRADFVHLKECAISIEDFPLAREVLSI